MYAIRSYYAVNFGVIESAFYAQGALAIGRQALGDRQQAGDALTQPQTQQAGRCQYDGIEFAGIQLGQTAVDVAAQIQHLQIGTAGPQLAFV